MSHRLPLAQRGNTKRNVYSVIALVHVASCTNVFYDATRDIIPRFIKQFREGYPKSQIFLLNVGVCNHEDPRVALLSPYYGHAKSQLGFQYEHSKPCQCRLL